MVDYALEAFMIVGKLADSIIMIKSMSEDLNLQAMA